MQCPNCSAQMQIMQRYEVDIDYCPSCKGVWLDRGEIDKIAQIESSHIGQHYNKYHYRRGGGDYDDDGLGNFDLDSFRELILEAKKRGLTSSDLASFFRLYNFFRGSGVKENEIESFITNINSGYIPPGKAIELINEIHEITKIRISSPRSGTGLCQAKIRTKERD
jgi:uncharacterized protein